jgi:hypothetical protein
MSRTQNLVLIGLLLAVGAATVIWLQVRDHADAAPAAPVPAAPAAVATPPAGQGSAVAAKPRVRRLPDRSGRDELLRHIRSVHAQRAARPASGSSSETTTPPPALPTPTLEKEYIRASVRELIPLIVECYEQGLARDSKLAGSIIVDFTIEGEPGVGGVVGESAIDPAASTLTDPAVRECVQETMFGIEIEPPEGGGVVKVRYPFEFRSDPE